MSAPAVTRGMPTTSWWGEGGGGWVQKYSTINHSVCGGFVNYLWDKGKGQTPCQSPAATSKTVHLPIESRIDLDNNSPSHVRSVLIEDNRSVSCLCYSSFCVCAGCLCFSPMPTLDKELITFLVFPKEIHSNI